MTCIWNYVILICLFQGISCRRLTDCKTDECIRYAKMVKENMNEKINPCDDFYLFNCGNFMNKVNVRPDKESVNQFQKLHHNILTMLADIEAKAVASINHKNDEDIWNSNAKAFYASCTKTEYVDNYSEPFVINLLNKVLGGWPMITGRPNPNTPLELLVKMYKYMLFEFVTISVWVNPKNPLKHIIKITQPNLNPKEFYYWNPYYESYTSYVRNISSFLNNTNNVRDHDIIELFLLEKKLSHIQITPAEKKSGTKNLEMTLGELQNEIPNFPWLEFISSIFADQPDVDLDESEIVSVDDWNYLVAMQHIFKEYSEQKPDVMKNYLFLNFFFSTLNDYLPEKYLLAKLGIQSLLTGIFQLENRRDFCIKRAMKFLPNEIGRIYINDNFKKQIKAEVKEISLRVIEEFKDMLDKNEWMDKISKNRAIEKAQFVVSQIGYPDYYDDENYIKNNYNYTLDPFNLASNVLTTLEYTQKVEILSTLRQPVESNASSSECILSCEQQPHIKTCSNLSKDLPAGILNPPFYGASLPMYINYGAIGFVIGHELTHGFDDHGRHYDKFGRYYSDQEEGLWDHETIKSFKKLVICMIDQYNGYFVRECNRTIDGIQTLGENIADNGGIKEAYRAYKRWSEDNREDVTLPGLDYSPEQLFFIGAAQVWCSKATNEALLTQMLTNPHSVPQYRVIGMMQNMLEFYTAFGCKKPEKICTVW